MRIEGCIVVCLAAMSLFAVPARRDWRTVTQPDGSTIQLRLTGDEFYHYWEDAQGQRYVQSDGGFVATGEVPTRAQVAARRAASPLMANRPRKISINLAPRGLLILVNFSDSTFRAENTREAMSDMMNKEGYDYNGATGSARDYFIAQSNGTYTPVFDVVGPVTLDHPAAYYGGNTTAKEGSDSQPHQMIIDACEKIDAQVDFTQYDNDENNEIDFVYVIYAGMGEADGGGPESIWPHNFYVYSGVGIDKSFDGKRLNNYACSGEINGFAGERNTIGTPAHEFGHVIGLPDYYDADEDKNGNNSGLTPNEWSIMDYGCYNNNGNTPPNYSLYDKEFLGWVTPKTLNKNEKANVTITTAYDDGYKLTDGATTYYIENRQQQGWDTYLYGHGMLVWRVQYDADAWKNNEVNNATGKVRYTVVSADGGDQVGWIWENISEPPGYNTLHDGDVDPFPGANVVTSWTAVTGYELTDIQEVSGEIRLKLNGGDSETGIGEVRSESADAVRCEKVLQDGQLVLRRGEKTFTVTGIRIE